MSGSTDPLRVDPDEALTLYAAAIVGAPELALQLQRLGVSEPDESLDYARLLRKDLMEEVERLRREGEG